MNEIQKELKSLTSQKIDLEKRLSTLKPGQHPVLQKKIQSFLISLSILETRISIQPLDDLSLLTFSTQLQSLKSSGESFQSKLNQYPSPSSSTTREDEILSNLSNLKEISNTILSELQQQNKHTQKVFKSFQNNTEIIQKAKTRLSRLENFLDCLPTPCLLTTLFMTFLSTFLVLLVL